MYLEEDDLRRAAESLIAEHGSEAAAEAERLASQSTKNGQKLTAAAWRKIRAAIIELQQD